MNIIFDTENIEAIKSNAVVLELDTFYFSKLDKTTTAYCVIENIKITDFDKVELIQQTHNQLILAYKEGNFKACHDYILQLTGALNGELDTFYKELSTRIQNIEPLVEWNPVIIK